MKKLSGVLQRVREIEYKYGISYAKTDGSLYKTLNVFYLIAGIYTLLVNSIFMLSCYLNTQKENMDKKAIFSILFFVMGVTVVLIIGYVLNRVRLYLAGGIVSIVSITALIICFGRELFGGPDLFGFYATYYWRHFIPLFLMLVLIVFMTVLAVRAEIKTNRQYKKVVANLYQNYNIKKGAEEEITEQEWEEFLSSYNPNEYKQQFKK